VHDLLGEFEEDDMGEEELEEFFGRGATDGAGGGATVDGGATTEDLIDLEGEGDGGAGVEEDGENNVNGDHVTWQSTSDVWEDF
jgi:hypothetical protein